MISYEYEDLFAEHDYVNMLIVPQGTTVTPVTNDAPTLTGNDWVINSDDDMVQESFELIESINSQENLVIGSVEGAYCTFTIYNSENIPNLEDKWVEVYLYFNENSETLFKVGVYKVKTDKYSSDRTTREISCYDLIQTLIGYDITGWYYNTFEGEDEITAGTLIEELFDYLADEREVFDGRTFVIEGLENLVNEDYGLIQGIDSDSITFEFFMQKLLEANGCFGFINREGSFVCKYLEWYDKPAVKTILNDEIFPPVQYSDEYTWGIGYVDVYNADNKRMWRVGSTNKAHPSIYVIVDSFVFAGKSTDDTETKEALEKMHNAIWHLRYKPYECECIGDLCVEVGDRIDIQYGEDENENPLTFYTYALERRFSGIQGFRDEYSASGSKRQPRYKITKNWQKNDSDDISTSGEGTSGISSVYDVSALDLIKYWRNIGIRLLQEPSNVSAEYDRTNGQVNLKWTDPADITTNAPMPCEWYGTIVVRKEGSKPYHRWDGDVLVDSHVRDEYSETAFVDDTAEPNKRYYYGIFPYHVALSDSDNPIGYYRFTKVVSVNTGSLMPAPTITGLQVYDVNVIATFEIPTLESGSYSYIKIVAKKGSIPTSKTDGIVKDLQASDTGVQFTGLDSESRYYFVIFASDGVTEVASDPEDCKTAISTVSWRIRPSDNMEFMFNSYGGGTRYKHSIADVKQRMIDNNLDICVMLPYTMPSVGEVGYDMHMFRFNDTNSIYLGDTNYLELTGYRVGCNRLPRDWTNTSWRFNGGGGISNQTGSTRQNATAPKTVNGITYSYLTDGYSESYPPIIVVANRSSYPKDVYYNDEV